jgi:hypothetical protein
VYGVEQSQGFAYVFGFHTFTMIVMILLGLLGLATESLSYAEISNRVLKQTEQSTGG